VQAVKRILSAIVWLAVAVLIALGGAGVVAAMNHVPATAARPELTWAADQAASARLDEATDHLETLTSSVESLGSYGRQALAAVVAGDVDQVNQVVAAGTLQLGAIEQASTDLEATLDAIPDVGNGSELLLSPEVQDRYDGLVPTPDFSKDLDDDWRLFTGRALDAANLNALLARHDQETAAAAQQGVKEKYPQALLLLDVSDATIRQTKAVRDRLAATTEVETLTRWIERAEQYDAALRHLYEVLVDADGKATRKVRAAFEAEQKARKRLPVDTRPLVLIMNDVAQGGLNQVVISIEETRQSLSDALEIQRQLEQDEDVDLGG
jgi:hypothetical protein